MLFIKNARNKRVYAGLSSFIITMKYNRLMAGVFSFLLVELVFFGLSANVALADSVRQQTVSVHKGWNAIYLHVTPTNTQPGSVFSGTPVSIVAANFGLTTSVQYVQNPGSISWKKDGWSVWYGPSTIPTARFRCWKIPTFFCTTRRFPI